jgi:O-6-methylguanine DNA methyltransferase
MASLCKHGNRYWIGCCVDGEHVSSSPAVGTAGGCSAIDSSRSSPRASIQHFGMQAVIAVDASLTTYAELGERIGRRSAARAVGNAAAANPISYLIPCHRVIRGMGVVGEYRWDSQRKHAMIAWETLRAGDIPRESIQEIML